MNREQLLAAVTTAEAAGDQDAITAAKAALAEFDAKAKEEEEKKKGPSDAEAKLLKELMENKRKAKEAEDRLKTFEGIDPEKAKIALKAQEEADRKALEARGEYDRIVKSINEQNEERIKKKDEEHETTKAALSSSEKLIKKLTVSQNFSNSGFIRDEIVLTPNKAEALYGDFFDLNDDGVLVGYDKPRGKDARTPLVDEKGTQLTFDKAIERIIKADPDYENIAKAKGKPGANSKTQETPPKKEVQQPSGLSRIQAGLLARKK